MPLAPDMAWGWTDHSAPWDGICHSAIWLMGFISPNSKAWGAFVNSPLALSRLNLLHHGTDTFPVWGRNHQALGRAIGHESVRWRG